VLEYLVDFGKLSILEVGEAGHSVGITQLGLNLPHFSHFSIRTLSETEPQGDTKLYII
jgi:hypothetical protein